MQMRGCEDGDRGNKKAKYIAALRLCWWDFYSGSGKKSFPILILAT